MKIDFSKLPEIINEKYYPYLWNTDRYLILVGGAGSGKSFFLAQKHTYRLFKENVGHRFLILRKYTPSLELSAFKLVVDVISDWHLMPYVRITQKPMRIINTLNGNEMYFSGMDDKEKVKSIQNITGIWYEESTEAGEEDILQLGLRLRPTFTLNKEDTLKLKIGIPVSEIGNYAQFCQSYNPISKENWTYRLNYNPKKLTYRKKIITDIDYNNKKQKITAYKTVLHSTYKDNKYLDPQYVADIEDLINKDEAYYKIYRKGEYADLKNKIFSNYKIIHEIPDVKWDKVYCGLDFGYVHPMALVKIYQKDDDEGKPVSLYCELLFHESNYHTAELIEWMKKHDFNKNLTIWCDSAEPDRIDELQKAGFDARKCYKSNNFVIDSIDFMKMLNIFILDRDIKLKDEFYSYRWKEDKDHNIKEEPIDVMDDGIKAITYGAYTEYIQGNRTPKVRWLRKNPFI